jgi:hypothetical protein
MNQSLSNVVRIFLVVGLSFHFVCVFSQSELARDFSKSLTFYASFDKGLEADVAKGTKTIYTAPAYNQLEAPTSGNLIESVKLATEGKFGGALAFEEKTKEVLFYLAGENVEYNDQPFDGTISLWLSLDPEIDLEPGYCDPIQITDVGYNDAAFWVDFSDKNPRLFRMGVFGDLAVWNPDNIGPDKNPSFYNRLVVAQERPFGSGLWTHVVIAYENINQKSGQASFYVNGKLQGSRTISEPFTWEVAKSKIFLGLNYIGLMDEVAIFSKSLNEEEIKLIYNSEESIGDLIGMD